MAAAWPGRAALWASLSSSLCDVGDVVARDVRGRGWHRWALTSGVGQAGQSVSLREWPRVRGVPWVASLVCGQGGRGCTYRRAKTTLE